MEFQLCILEEYRKGVIHNLWGWGAVAGGGGGGWGGGGGGGVGGGGGGVSFIDGVRKLDFSP